MDSATLLAIVTLITTIVGFVYTWFKDARDRKWKLEDSQRNSHHMATQDDAIADGTRKAGAAYSEANAANVKIATLQEQLKEALEKGRKTD